MTPSPFTLTPPKELLDSLEKVDVQLASTKALIDNLEKGGFDVTAIKAQYEALLKWSEGFRSLVTPAKGNQ